MSPSLGNERYQQVRLRDGRTLSYSEAGPADGVPVLHCHGSPGSRLERWGGRQPYIAAGARLITVDRPGIGRSDAQPSRAVLDWPGDVAELMDAIGLRRFGVMAHSLGAAYALACAYALPERVAAVAIAAGIPRLDEEDGVEQMGTARYWLMARERPVVMRAVYAGFAGVLRFAPPLGHRLFFRHASVPDRLAVDPPEVRRRFRSTVLEAARSGPAGLVEDMRVALRPWGFSLRDIGKPVSFWHGRQDQHVPPGAAEWCADAIPRADLTLLDEEGHFSVAERQAERIVRGLVERMVGGDVT